MPRNNEQVKREDNYISIHSRLAIVRAPLLIIAINKSSMLGFLSRNPNSTNTKNLNVGT